MTEMDGSIQELLHRHDTTVLSPEQRWDLAKRAERLAEEAGDKEALYAIRMRLVGTAHLVADARAQLSLFLWCAHMHDMDPVRFPARPVPHIPDLDLLWSYKWLTGMMCAWPQYSLAQIRSAIDMMRSAYQRAGVGRAGVLWAEFHYALEAGDDDDLREALARIRATPTDEYSNCEACSRASEINVWISLNDEPRALRLYDELMRGGYECAEEPESIVSECLGLLLRSDRMQEAVRAQQYSYPRIMHGPAFLSVQCHHIMFFLVTGNPERAYALVCRHLAGLWHEGLSPAAQLGALASFVRISTLLIRAGFAEREMPGTDSAAARAFLAVPADGTGQGPQPLTVEEFLPLAHARAAELAAQFDARNGHTRSAQMVEDAAAAKVTMVPVDVSRQHRSELAQKAQQVARVRSHPVSVEQQWMLAVALVEWAQLRASTGLESHARIEELLSEASAIVEALDDGAPGWQSLRGAIESLRELGAS